MPCKHVHDAGLALCSRPAPGGHLRKIQAHNLRLSKAEAGRSRQNGVLAQGRGQVPHAGLGHALRGSGKPETGKAVANQRVVELCQKVRELGHCVTLGANGKGNLAFLEKLAHYLPPGGCAIVFHPLLPHPGCNKRFRVRIKAPGSWPRGPHAAIDSVQSLAQEIHDAVRWCCLAQGRAQEGKKVDEKACVGRQGPFAAKGCVKGVYGSLAHVAKPCKDCQMALFRRKALANKLYDACTGGADVDDCEPGKPCLAWAQHKEEVQGIEEEGLAGPHACKADLVPACLQRVKQSHGHELAVRCAQRHIAPLSFPWRGRSKERQKAHCLVQGCYGLWGRLVGCCGWQGCAVEGQGFA